MVQCDGGNRTGAVLGLFRVISTFCGTSVPQNEEITRKSPMCAVDVGDEYIICPCGGRVGGGACN